MRSLSPVGAALALVALALPLSIAGTNMSLALLTAALLWSARRNARRIVSTWQREPALAAIALYAVAGLVAALFSVMPQTSFPDAFKDFHRVWTLLLFTAAFALEAEAPAGPALASGFVLTALYGIGQTAFLRGGDSAYPTLYRAHAFVHPVVFGEQMCLALLAALCILIRPGDISERSHRHLILFSALTATALVLSQTRMALFAVMVGLLGMAALEPRARRWLLPALVLGAAVATTWEFLPVGGRTLSNLLNGFHPNDPNQARFALWQTAWDIFKNHPWTGVGPGGFRLVFPAYHPSPLDGELIWGSAHNLYLHQLAERGVLGASALLVLLGTLCVRAWRAARDGSGLGLCAAACVAAFLALSLTETSFQNEQFATLFLFLWAWGTRELRAQPEIL